MISYIAPPAWLEAPAERLRRLPVITRSQGLPFEELSWPNFERLILRVVKDERAVSECQVYGTPGQDQHGIDLLATLRKAPATLGAYQCKKVENFGASDVRKAVLTFEQGRWASQVQEFTLCVASALEKTPVVEAIAAERARLAERGIQLVMWDGSEGGALNLRLKMLPQIVDDFFGREWVRAFNGDEAAQQLGDKLDGIDFDALRARLADLYATIFTQHDPGLRAQYTEPIDYLDRYVAADVLENTVLEGLAPARLNQRSVEHPRAIPVATEAGREQRPVAHVLESLSSRRSAWDWLREQNDCVILGEPGHGKSALLRYLALVLARANFERDAPIGSAHLHRLPVWLSFARAAAAIAADPNINIEDFYCRWLHQYGYGDVQPLFRRALRSSELLILVDGLDEATSELSGREAIDRLITFSRSHRAILICTSRPRGFSSLPIPAVWPNANLAPLDDRQIKQFATQLFALIELPGTEPIEWRRLRARPRGEAFFNAVKANPRTQELARNPLLCQALIELFRLSHRLPEARARAYAEILELFLRRHPQARAHAGSAPAPAALKGIRETDLKAMLVQIALDTQRRAGGGITSRERCIELCTQYLEDDQEGLGISHPQAIRRSPDIVESLINHFGVLIERSAADVSLVHLSLQEFLAAEGMSNRGESEQLDWLRSIALQPRWRECLITWFAILGERGRRPLAGRAIRVLVDMAKAGEWERLQLLSLRTELACSDIGLPVSDARNIVAEAVNEIDHSPFERLRTRLARSVTVGALGGSIQSECATAIARWTPARPLYARAHLLSALGKWIPKEDLGGTLRKALLDDSVECRRAAAKSLADVFAADPQVKEHLVELAHTHTRPEVRAAALHGLMQQRDWWPAAAVVADRNAASHSPELTFTCSAARVTLGQQSAEDLRTLRTLWLTESLEYSLRNELIDVTINGWPRAPDLRDDCLKVLRSERGTHDFPFPLEYLVGSYPADEEIASVIADLFDRYQFHFVLDPSRFWELLRAGYQGNRVVANALRTALTEHRRRYEAIHWHPQTTPAYLVLGDETARDDLLSAYVTADEQSRYWIATTLIDGWPDDPLVAENLMRWSHDAPALAAPLAEFAQRLRPDPAERHAWLEHLVVESDDRLVGQAMRVLLAERPNESTLTLVESQLGRPHLWYYMRVGIEARIAATYPDHPLSRSIVDRALAEVDGPSIATFAGAYEHDPIIRPQLLIAAAPAPVDVRLTASGVLSERGGPPGLIEELTPAILSEEAGAVRTSGLIARARACRFEPASAVALARVLIAEAMAMGTYTYCRRRSGFAALLELGDLERASGLLRNDDVHWEIRWMDPLDPDLVALQTILEHWPSLQVFMADSDSRRELPLENLIDEGYGPVLERVPSLRTSIDSVLQTTAPTRWNHGFHLELLARRFPRSPVLRQVLLQQLRAPFTGVSHSRSNIPLSARLLSDHFGGEDDVLAELLGSDRPGTLAAPAEPGLLGHLVRGWPASVMARQARELSTSNFQKWPVTDRLLCATTWGLSDEAQAAAVEIVGKRYALHFTNPESAEALRVWAKSDMAQSVLAGWHQSEDGDRSVTALALSAELIGTFDFNVEGLRARFNHAFANTAGVGLDGFDALSGLLMPWSVRAFAVLDIALGVSA